jgi:hypothetical protein
MSCRCCHPGSPILPSRALRLSSLRVSRAAAASAGTRLQDLIPSVTVQENFGMAEGVLIPCASTIHLMCVLKPSAEDLPDDDHASDETTTRRLRRGRRARCAGPSAARLRAPSTRASYARASTVRAI